jgi:hypothetical protein
MESDNGASTSYCHTIFIMSISYGAIINSVLYFVDLGSPETKGGKKSREGIVV